MSEKKKIEVSEAKAETKAETNQVYETKYSVEELVEAAETFHVKPIMAKSALLSAGMKSYTVSEARKIINDFKNKEVKA